MFYNWSSPALYVSDTYKPRALCGLYCAAGLLLFSYLGTAVHLPTCLLGLLGHAAHSLTTSKSLIGVLLQGNANCHEEWPKIWQTALKSATKSRSPPQSVVDTLIHHGQRFSAISCKNAVEDLRSLSQMSIFAISCPRSVPLKVGHAQLSLQ